VTETRTLNLVKGTDRHVIRYAVGEEAAVLDSLIGMVNDPAVRFDWFDAAAMSHELGQHLAKELKTHLKQG
jgi:hypothetical protein